MYKYTVGQNSWDSYSEIELLHNNKYTKEEFLNICKEVFKKLDTKDKKIIVGSYADEGADLIAKVLVKEYGFILETTTAHVHIGRLYDDNYRGCEYCSKSYVLNNENKCSDLKCEFREFLKEARLF